MNPWTEASYDRARGALAGLAAILLAVSCTTSRPASFGGPTAIQPPVAIPTPRVEIVAVVESLDRAAHTDDLEGGGVYVTNVVSFMVVDPPGVHELLSAHGPGHPWVHDRPLLLGSVVRFNVPANWRDCDLSYGDLQDLRFANEANQP